MSNWHVYSEGWMAEGHRAMISYIEGLREDGWCVECSEINPHPLYGEPKWAIEYELGYRYYVLEYNLYNRNEDRVKFYKDPDEAQKAFEEARDPFGIHSS